MRTLKLTIAYDGTRYAGWQVQHSSTQQTAHSTQKPTIQGTLERVLQRVLQEPVKVIGSGRTDAGVHATGQVAHLTTRTSLPTQRLVRSLNQLLPQDIAVSRIEQANGSFHARFDACRKRYRYRLFLRPVVPPFIRPYVHPVRHPLNLALMRREAAALKGRHDFRAFARVPPEPSAHRGEGEAGGGRSLKSTRPPITSVQVRRRGDELHLEVEGTGFLHMMVRSLVGTLLDIGRGRRPPGTIHRMLTTGDRRLAGTTAPAKGLSLIRVEY